jgi:hypothetical protein
MWEGTWGAPGLRVFISHNARSSIALLPNHPNKFQFGLKFKLCSSIHLGAEPSYQRVGFRTCACHYFAQRWRPAQEGVRTHHRHSCQPATYKDSMSIALDYVSFAAASYCDASYMCARLIERPCMWEATAGKLCFTCEFRIS